MSVDDGAAEGAGRIRTATERFAGPLERGQARECLEFSCHFNHRSPKTEMTKQILCSWILLSGPEHDARRAVHAKPIGGCFHERTRDTNSSAGILDNYVMNKSRHVA